ncbi:MAG TPA: CDGSH iron-sulfur domain-containing protein [Rubricoccaceae bacterium]|nr:CDGSH iron-sulfur domain-containing protein [Rubricoccaceae bacterium]
MSEKTYPADGVEVRYAVRRCIHAEACVRGLPRVFDPRRRPWIDPTQAPPDAVAEVVMRCPTGALHFTRTDGGAQEPVPATNTVAVQPSGPLYVRGDVRVETPEGEVILRDTRVAFCRCGRSRNKPFCDNSHLDAFTDEGRLGTHGATPPEGEGPLRVVLAKDGPLLLRGPVTITGADGAEVTTAKCALCRCGFSSNKPFCDGTHKRVGFVAEAAFRA